MALFPLTFPVFRPAMQVIISITTNAVQDQVLFTVTTGQNHNYQVGLIVRMDIPQSFGMVSLNNQTLQIIEIPMPNQFVVSQNSFFASHNNPFVIPGGALQSAQVVPIAEYGQLLSQAVMNVLPY